MKVKSVLTIISLSLVSGLVFAAGDPPAPPGDDKKKDAVIEKYTAASAKQDWTAAAAAVREGVQTSPNNADYHNLYAYSVRKGPNPDMELVFTHYNEALRINPKHRGAHEYIGEAYLQVDNLTKAKEHLARLDKLCFLPCEEYTDLKKAVAAYEAGHKAAASNW